MGVITDTEHQRLSDRFDLIAGDAACIRLTNIKLDGLDKFLKRRRLQDNVTFLIRYEACSVKDYAVIAANQIDENDRLLLQFGPMGNHIASQPDLAFVVWRSVYRDDHVGTHRDDLVCRVALVKPLLPKCFVVPKIFADDDA